MEHAEICPICKGTGKIAKDTKTTLGFFEDVCHGCGGKGWIVVGEDEKFSPIYPPPYYPWQPLLTDCGYISDGGISECVQE